MKKFFSNILLGAALFAVAACDSLDLQPESEITDANYWRTTDHFSAFNVGIHSYFRNYSYNYFLLGEPRADIYGDTPFGGEATQGMERFPYNTISEVQPGISNYAGLYNVINQCNLMISKTTDTSVLSDTDRKYFLGAAYGIRAYLYFHLLRSWGDVFVYLDYTNGATLDLSKLNRKQDAAAEVMTQIKKDIQASEEAFGTSYAFTKGKYYWSLGATKMLKGEVYLWSGKQMNGGSSDYQTAKAALQEVKNCPNVALLPDFANVFSFNNKLNNEIIFAFVSNENEFDLWNGSYRGNLLPQQAYMNNGSYYDETGTNIKETKDSQINGLTRLAIKKDLYFKLYREGDSRKTASLKAVYNKNAAGELVYVAPFAYKFQGTMLTGGSTRSMLDDYPIYRYSDCLLLLAEAKAFLNEDITAEINEVRKRAYGSNYSETVAYPNDKGDFYTDNKFVSGDEDPSEAILKERFREFLFEGRRWYDIRLFGLTSKYSTASVDKLLWPIDQSTLTNNNLLEQTPGYKD